MKMKKMICALLAGAALLTTSAMAKDNIYAYNKFVSTVLGPQLGYCDFAASFAGHENDFDNVNDYFAGLISAFYNDIDDDRDNELMTVDTQHGVALYRMGDAGVVFLGSIDFDVIENYGDSYTNVFEIPIGAKYYIGVEHYDKSVNEYKMEFYELNAGSDEFNKMVDISRESNEDGTEESVWAANKTYYSVTSGGGFQTKMNPDNFPDCASAALAALKDAAPGAGFTYDILNERINGNVPAGSERLNVAGVDVKTSVRATGIRFTDKPVVIFEDNSQLNELKVKPDIVTVVLDGRNLQFPVQDPVIIDGRTLVPMRTIFEALGAEVEWIDDGTTQSIVATTADTTINMAINSKVFTVNGEEKTLDVPPQLINDKTLVPIRAVSESLGCYVGWDGDAKTVLIQSHTDSAQ